MFEKNLRVMLDLQESMNQKVNPNWFALNHPWHRAIWTECAEMLEHHGWKWWKLQEPDIEQVKLEMVDIFHFILSWAIQEYPENDDALIAILDNMPTDSAYEADVSELIESLASSALDESLLETIYTFFTLLYELGVDYIELYQWYVGKNVLNMFRQDHGYKQGTYQKIWNEEEDNVVLARLLVPVYEQYGAATFAASLYLYLTEAYKEALTHNKADA